MEGGMILPGYCLLVVLVFITYLWDGVSEVLFDSSKTTTQNILHKFEL
jgi:hypothetical protein